MQIPDSQAAPSDGGPGTSNHPFVTLQRAHSNPTRPTIEGSLNMAIEGSLSPTGLFALDRRTDQQIGKGSAIVII